MPTPFTSTLRTIDWDTPSTFTLLVAERSKPCPSILRLDRQRYTLNVSTASCGKEYTPHAHTSGGKRSTPHIQYCGGNGYTLHLHKEVDGGKEITLHVYCLYTADDRNGYTMNVHTSCSGKAYTLHIHSAGSGKGNTILHILTVGSCGGERDTPCTSKLKVGERDAPCMSKLKEGERDIPCISKLKAGKRDAPCRIPIRHFFS
jgi:hypothetical protein